MAMSCSWFGTSLALNARVSRCGVIGISFPKVAENFSSIMGKCERACHMKLRSVIWSVGMFTCTLFLSFRFKSFRLKDSVDCLHETLSNPIWCLHVPALFKSGWRCDMRTLAYVLFAWMAKMDAARVSVCLAIFKLMWNRSLNNKDIIVYIVCHCDFNLPASTSAELWRLSHFNNVSDLGSHMKWPGADWKNRICAVQIVIRKSDMGHIWNFFWDLGHFSLQWELSLRSI